MLGSTNLGGGEHRIINQVPFESDARPEERRPPALRLAGLREEGLGPPPSSIESEENKKRARRGTLFIQEASAAAISHRLDSDRFEPLYAYRTGDNAPLNQAYDR